MITGSIASTELILMILRDTHAYLFFRCFFHCIFECVFQSLIVLTKTDEESTLLIFRTTNKGNELRIRVITKLPNSEQSYKGKVKTHKYINRQNQSTTGKL